MSAATLQLRDLAREYRTASRQITNPDGTIPYRTTAWLIGQARTLTLAAELVDDGAHSDTYAEALFDAALDRLTTFEATLAPAQNGARR